MPNQEPMIKVQDVRFRYDPEQPKYAVDGVSLDIRRGEFVAVLGANGCGKSTLFAAVLGDLSPEDGDIETPPRDRIAHVAQSFVADNVPAVDFVLGGHAPLIAARAALAEAEKAGDDMRLAQAHANLAELNEGAIVAQARTILAGLGFSQTDVDRPVYDFSGGWRNRIALGRADEPSRHRLAHLARELAAPRRGDRRHHLA